ncbi:hypothetical protein PAEN110709_17850 [Paenibacillus endophyticus]
MGERIIEEEYGYGMTNTYFGSRSRKMIVIEIFAG